MTQQFGLNPVNEIKELIVNLKTEYLTFYHLLLHCEAFNKDFCAHKMSGGNLCESNPGLSASESGMLTTGTTKQLLKYIINN